jgi:hypothetical protein
MHSLTSFSGAFRAVIDDAWPSTIYSYEIVNYVDAAIKRLETAFWTALLDLLLDGKPKSASSSSRTRRPLRAATSRWSCRIHCPAARLISLTGSPRTRDAGMRMLKGWRDA